MSSEPPLIGHYFSGQFVTVNGENASDELRLLGYFGHNLESAKRKEDDRRGPLDRRVLEELKGSITASTTLLTLHEAFYLAYAFGCLRIVLDDIGAISLDTCWSAFRKYHEKSNISLDFAVEYGVYHYFKSRGWTVKTGDNYGTNFLLYRLGPSMDHAQYAVHIIYDPIQRSCSAWNSLLAKYRVVQSVCKELLLVYVVTTGSNSTFFDKPGCIKNMKISIENFTCKTNLMI